ncbi:MAG: zinc ABC transporter substrate-binding protein [Lachnospiraceae bacterium]|nr:zinc ABC transporter substrate-binding protein [Lachnospiraceae bacterium]
MKKVFLVVSLIASMVVIGACSKTDVTQNVSASEDSKKIKIVTTIYPEYDWVSNIIKGNEEKFDLSILMTSGVDLHNFQPTAKDILDIGTADLFIYVGGESDKWAEGAIRQAVNKDLKTINLMELLRDKVKIEELKEGMEEEEHHHDEEDGEEHHEGEEEEHHEEEIEYDEHVWLSLENAITVCSYLKSEIEALDSDNANVYENNLTTYLEELNKLNDEYKNVVSSAKRKVLLFGDRFPFRYMVDDYGIDYFAAFKGCAAETEASFKTIKFLADKLGEENLPYVMKIERSEDKIAKAVIENSNKKDAKIETMYSIQAVSSDEMKKGETYLSYMKKNLEVLKKVLN